MDQTEITNKIVRYVIKSTPFGQAPLVIKDLTKIISTLNPQDEVVLKALKEHNEDHLAIFRKDNDAKDYVISSVLNSQENFYVDQKKSLAIKVDQEKYTIVSSEEVPLPTDPTLNALRDSIEFELRAYLNAYYTDKLSGFYVMYTGDANQWTMFIGISAKTINLPNFYCGDWVSKWEITSSEVKGDALIQAHYYEEGNVQLKNSNKFQQNLTVDVSTPEASAKLLVESIARFENGHQDSMQKLYDNMPELCFKSMRRALPVTGNKMDWNVHVHKVAQSLKQQ